MKSLIQAVAVAAALVVPVASFAQQSNAPVTRAQVRAELVQLEQAGYRPGISDPFYPANIQAAEARVSEQNSSASAYGGVANATAVGVHATAPAASTGVKPVYFGQ
ncbi:MULTISPECIES: DUF4148 domain-containing protein [Paraburkholderia]|jgi:hypothetical protein|uniref:Purine-nucleoside phosphorylase n=1 Tax=Paraburkholderia phenazinium TaxID=60549 RepID=A0A1N6F8H6_9BURK|nr:DUF4148 domain-containing protein [Paraburkholderia phenazinium]SIN91593.1 protein of unknown function [Paraburkholderia phenazinium]